MRNFSKTLAVLSLLAPASAHSIGIGDIKLHSALNERLNAEIALTLDAGENAGDIRIKLAPIEKFDRSGIPWSYFLTKIKFEPVAKSNGLVVVKLSSTETVSEPFLDFLLEVTSPEGSQYREFTVLIDPPSSYERPLSPATALPAIAARQSSMSRGAYERQPRESVSRPASSVPVSAPDGQDGTIVVRKNDTLSRIAARANAYSDVSDEQMAIALFQANPQAFFKNNINALTAGRTLNVPEKQAVLRLTRKQAAAEFRRQNQTWRGGVEAESGLAEEGAEEAKLTLAAPTETEIGREKQAAPAGETNNVSGGEKPTAGQSGLPSQQNQQMQERMRLLEEKLAQMEKMMAVKDAQLAILQHGGAVKPEGTPPQPETLPPAAPQPETVAPTPAPAPQPETAAPQPPTPAPEHAPEAAAPPATPAPQPEAPVKPQPQIPRPAAVPQPAKPHLTAPQVQPEETPVVTYAILGSVGAALLGMFSWLYLRKRRIEEEQSRESMFASSSQISLPSVDDELLVPNVIEDTHGFGGVGGVASTSSFLNDFGSDFTFFDTDQNEVDPISEADVYLAYGRYQQAEELIRNAIAEQPERDECKLKLLEIFYTNNNKQGFEDYVKELLQAGKKNDAKFWNRVTEMGAEIIPDSALFANVKLPGTDFIERPGRKEETEPKESSGPDLAVAAESHQLADFSVPEDDEQPVAQEASSSAQVDDVHAEANDALDFDLSTFQKSLSEDFAGKTEAAKEEFEAFDFNLDTGAAQQDDSASMDIGAENESLESLDSFDFFADIGKSTSDGVSAVDTDLGLDFGNIDDVEPGAEFSQLESMPETIDFSEKAEDLTGKSGRVHLEDMDDVPTEDFHSLDFGSDLVLTDMDELETKIDLAKAYIDMGDPEAAKEIAEDVLARGNAEQKREAQAIINGL